MNKAFEKILEKIECTKLPFPDECSSYYGNTNKLLDMVKEIVLEVAEEYRQPAEWLEELKAYKETKCNKSVYLASISLDKIDAVNKGYSDGYNKAIDDYMNKLCNHCMQQTNECYKLECPFCTDGCDIVNISEQLKAGGENESK